MVRIRQFLQVRGSSQSMSISNRSLLGLYFSMVIQNSQQGISFTDVEEPEDEEDPYTSYFLNLIIHQYNHAYYSFKTSSFIKIFNQKPSFIVIQCQFISIHPYFYISSSNLSNQSSDQLLIGFFDIFTPKYIKFLIFIPFFILFELALYILYVYIIYRQCNLNLNMKNLAYIPTKVDKEQLYEQLQEKIQKQHQGNIIQEDFVAEESRKRLTKQQLNLLLQRLTKATKKQYDTQQQTTHILTVNLELKKRRFQSQKVQNRLIQYGKKVAEKKIEMQTQMKNEIKQKYHREIPEITEKGRNMQQKSIDLRLKQIINERNQHQQTLKEKYEPSFRPIIDPHSQFINDIQNHGDLHNRMELKQKQANKRKESLLKKIQIKNQEEMPFKPMICQKSREIAEKIPRKPLSIAHTTSRQQNYYEETLDLSIYPFAPQINKNTDQILKNKKEKYDSNCFQRLYSQAKQISIKNKEKFEQKYNKSNFRPKINEKSLKILDQKQRNSHKQSVNDISYEQYEQIKIGGTNQDQKSRTKCYSLRNLPQKQKFWQLNLKDQCLNILNKNNKLRMSFIR